jgi:hypothetical protein
MDQKKGQKERRTKLEDIQSEDIGAIHEQR